MHSTLGQPGEAPSAAPAARQRAPPCGGPAPASARRPRCPRPTAARRSAQSSCASTSAASSGRPRPRCSAGSCARGKCMLVCPLPADAGRARPHPPLSRPSGERALKGARAGALRAGARLLNCMVLMLKPSVGLMVVVSSPLMRFTTVVLPALSRPLRAQRLWRQPEGQPMRTRASD